jgi:hypothetical protein
MLKRGAKIRRMRVKKRQGMSIVEKALDYFNKGFN